eukprot:403350513
MLTKQNLTHLQKLPSDQVMSESLRVKSLKSNFLSQQRQNNLQQPNNTHLKQYYPGNNLKQNSIQNQDLQLRNQSLMGELNQQSRLLPQIHMSKDIQKNQYQTIDGRATDQQSKYQSQPMSPVASQQKKQLDSKQSMNRYLSQDKLQADNQNLITRPLSKSSSVKQIALLRDQKQNQNQMLQSPSNGLQKSQSVSQMQTQESFKTYMRNDDQSLKRIVHPLTGEEHFLDKKDFLANTQKCPFQVSVRDNTNYYFQHQKELEKYLDSKQSPQKTFNRRLKIRNTYMTMFPSYGLYENKKQFTCTQFSHIGTQLEKADPVDHEHFVKVDHMKIYYEEMLKAKNMRMNKK